MKTMIPHLLGALVVAMMPLAAQTIADKKAGIASGGADFDQDTQKLLGSVNSILSEKQALLKSLYEDVQVLYVEKASPEDFRRALAEINRVREEIAAAERTWRGAITQVGAGEGYALWNQPDTTLEQLIIDYGSQEYVYVVPQDIGKIKLTVASSIPVPRALWGEMLEHILAQNGISVRQLNPYLRQLYYSSESQTGLRNITNDRSALEYLSNSDRVGFFVSPDSAEVRRVGFFLEKFLNPNTTSLSMVGRDMLIVSSVGEVKELLKLYDFVTAHRGELEYKLVPLRRVDTEEMAKVLDSMFEQFAKEEEIYESDDGGTASKGRKSSSRKRSRSRKGGPSGDVQGLKVIPLKDVARAVFLVGLSEEIDRATRIIEEVEAAVGKARDKVVITYRVKHSDPEELAKVLAQVYDLLLIEGVGSETVEKEELEAQKPNVAQEPAAPAPTIVVAQENSNPYGVKNPFPTTLDDSPHFFQAGQISINPTPIRAEPAKEKEYNKGRNNFLVDPRTSNIVMVLDPILVPRIKALLRRVDVPKKMVQIDVLLVEYTNRHTNNYGLNLMRMGGCASNTHNTCMLFNDAGQLAGGGIVGSSSAATALSGAGIFSFLLSREKNSSHPAFDMACSYHMLQEDASINSNPSVVTLNQEEATLNVSRETSISTGTVQVNETGGVQSKDAFTRAQYGTKITITPTIHTRGDDPEDWWGDEPDYVTLDTQVNIDNFIAGTGANARPDILRREVKNIARVPDGQTVIIGGLKNKNITDSKDMVPFLGEIPGVGKCFSHNRMNDEAVEMFIYITPTIIYDPCEGFERVKREQLARRPGDIPYFMCAVDRGKTVERNRAYKLGMDQLYGRKYERCVWWGDDHCYGSGAPWSQQGTCDNDCCDYSRPKGCNSCGGGQSHQRTYSEPQGSCSDGCGGRAHW